MPTRSSGTPATTTRPPDDSSTRSSIAMASRSATSAVGLDGFIGVAFSRLQQPLWHSGQGCHRQPHAHRHAAGQDPVARANGACAITASRRSASGSALRTMPTTKSASSPARPRSARASPTRKTKAAWRCSIFLFRRLLASSRGAVGTQFGHRKVVATSFEGDSLLEPARTNTHCGVLVRGTAGHQAAALQAAARIEQATVDGTGLDLTDPERR